MICGEKAFTGIPFALFGAKGERVMKRETVTFYLPAILFVFFIFLSCGGGGEKVLDFPGGA